MRENDAFRENEEAVGAEDPLVEGRETVLASHPLQPIWEVVLQQLRWELIGLLSLLVLAVLFGGGRGWVRISLGIVHATVVTIGALLGVCGLAVVIVLFALWAARLTGPLAFLLLVFSASLVLLLLAFALSRRGAKRIGISSAFQSVLKWSLFGSSLLVLSLWLDFAPIAYAVFCVAAFLLVAPGYFLLARWLPSGNGTDPSRKTLLLSLLCGGIGFVYVCGAPNLASLDRQEHPSRWCRSRLRDICEALELYKSQFGAYPQVEGEAYLCELLRCRRIGLDVRGLLCPDGDAEAGSRFCEAARRWDADWLRRGAPADAVMDLPFWHTDYEANPKLAGKGDEAYDVPDPAATPWVWEKRVFHERADVRNVLFLDGHTEPVSEDRFQTLMKGAE